MKKNFKIYAVCWAILLAIFNVICFVTPNEVAGYVKFDAAFWTGYIFITLAFIGQLGCAYAAFKADSLQKFFYKLSLIKISYTGLVLTIIAGALCMMIPNLPYWIGIIVCLVVLGFNAIAIIKASAVAETVAKIDEKIKAQTSFIRLLTVDAENLVNCAKSDAAKAECKKVYEAVRYSDPMSSEALSVTEAGITAKFDELTAAVTAADDAKISEIADEVVLLVKERNNKCKVLK